MRREFRERIVDDLRGAARRDRWQEHIEQHGTPLMLFDPGRVVAGYRRLVAALPDVAFHYAIKAQPIADVVRVLAAEGCRFDVASRAEVNLARALRVSGTDCLYSNPHKKRTDIVHARLAGVRRFVVDNPGEVAKLAAVAPDAHALFRVSSPSEAAHCDLSTKFGAEPDGVIVLVKTALSLGITPAGICLHVGSQCADPEAFGTAIGQALTLVDDVVRHTGVRLPVIDIGGGFPVPYRSEVPSIERIAEAIDRGFGTRREEFEILAEPGRYLVAPSMTLVTSVVGASTRGGGEWRFLDDGLYGSYSNVLAEQITPAIVGASEIFERALPTEPTTLAGPTCDGVDVVIRDHPMPTLAEGDLVISPMMGAYTTATCTGFNGFGDVRIVDVRRSAEVSSTSDLPW